MTILFDTSVMVAAVVDQLPQHERALSCFVKHTKSPHTACCTTHTLAECYTTLTALPLPRRIQPFEALHLIETNFSKKLRILEIKPRDYHNAIKRVAELGLRSGIIYDALHLACAEKKSCETLFTFNNRHFEHLQPEGVTIQTP